MGKILKRAHINQEFILLCYYEDENIFTDGEGHIIYNMFELITPNDLFLFRHDRGNNCFRLVYDPRFMCEIISIPDEVCGHQTKPHILLGDDYERIDRFERANNNGYNMKGDQYG